MIIMSETVNPHNREEIQIDDSLTLRALNPDQADELFSVTEASRDYLGQWLPWAYETNEVQDSADFIAKTNQKRRDSSELGYGILLDNKIVGHISLMHLADEKEPEIGYWVSEDFAGRGVTTKAAEALTNFAINVLGLDKIIIKADPKNIGSNRVAEKLGYKLNRQEFHETEGLRNVWVKSSYE